MKEFYFATRTEWRNWLERNHDKEAGIWLVFYKKATGKQTLSYDEAVEEALCFGWIDGVIKRLDDERYARKLTPRKPGSHWSETNKKRVGTLMSKGLLAEPGLAKVKEAKKSGLWEAERPRLTLEVPQELAKALAKNRKAKAYFEQLAPSYRKQFIGWVALAKRQETKERRVAESIALLEKGEKLGLK